MNEEHQKANGQTGSFKSRTDELFEKRKFMVLIKENKQTNKKTNKQTRKQTNKQENIDMHFLC